MIKKSCWILIFLTIVIVNIFRFCWLDQVPYGFNVDELAGSVSIQCMETQGTDAHLKPHPLFFDQHYGTPKPPVYGYPAVLWEKIFGHTTDKLRAFTVFGNIFTVLGLFFLARMMLGTSYGLIVALIASLSPWAWGLSRIAYESTFCATFLVWGMFFFLRSSRWADKIWAAFFFACAVYVYPPARLQTPFVLLTLLAFDFKRQGQPPKKTLPGFLIAFVVFCLPLAYYTLFGNLQQRFGEISIFNPIFLQSVGKTNSFHDLVGIFINNYALHFSPQYLFVTGDPSWEHSTQHFGLLGWLDILGLVALVFFLIFRFKDISPNKWWLIFLAVNFFLDIIPVSLTAGGLPNALRTIGAFPFACLLTGYGLWILCERGRFFFPLSACLGIIFAFFFLKTYFTVYPKESMGWFSFWTKEEALNARTDQDWLKFMVRYKDQDYHFRYYVMNYHGDSCSQSRAMWIKMRQMLGLPKAY